VLPDISVVWVILAVLLLAVALDRLLFKPLLRTMRERETAIKSAMELAQSAADKAEAATAEFNAKVGAARADLYKQMDDRRKAAEQYRAEVMAKTREEVDASLAAAKVQLDQQAAAAKAQLEAEADTLGREIAQKVLGRTASVLLLFAVTLFFSAATVSAQEHAPATAHEATSAPAAQPAAAAAPAEHASAPANAPAEAVPEHAAAAEHVAKAEHGGAEGEHGGGEHGSSIIGMVAKLFNFAILAGTLVYFLRAPLAEYLTGRKAQIRSELVKAADMKTSAATQLAAVDEKLAALPGELDALRQSGAAEVATEEARIRELAGKERERLLTQMNREIELHGKTAERELVRVAADRAVAAAEREIAGSMTPADHARLQDRYVAMVGK
jgi:F-type H+-transporting ATPase subunit b